MALIGNAYVKLDKLRQIVEACEENGLDGFKFDVMIGEVKYNENISFAASQSKEQREAKEKKWYFGNGKVVWNDGKPIEVVKFENRS